MDELFTFEEISLMRVFDTSGRDKLIVGITSAIQYFEEPEMIEIASSVLSKLNDMSGEDYTALELYREQGNQENKEV